MAAEKYIITDDSMPEWRETANSEESANVKASRHAENVHPDSPRHFLGKHIRIEKIQPKSK